MALFQMKWLRRLVRRHTAPIPEPVALKWKERISMMYGLLAWHTFGLVLYFTIKGRMNADEKTEKGDMGESSTVRLTKVLNIEKGRIVRFSGFNKIDDLEFDNSTKQSLDE